MFCRVGAAVVGKAARFVRVAAFAGRFDELVDGVSVAVRGGSEQKPAKWLHFFHFEG